MTPFPARPTRAEKKAERAAKAEAEEARKVDEILAKIAEQGMDSLTSRERQLLERDTERKRRTQR